MFVPNQEERDAEKIRLLDKEKTDRFVRVLVDQDDPTMLTVVTKDDQYLPTPLHTFKVYSPLEAKRILSLISWEGTVNRKARHIFASAIIEMEDAIAKAEQKKADIERYKWELEMKEKLDDWYKEYVAKEAREKAERETMRIAEEMRRRRNQVQVFFNDDGTGVTVEKGDKSLYVRLDFIYGYPLSVLIEVMNALDDCPNPTAIQARQKIKDFLDDQRRRGSF